MKTVWAFLTFLADLFFFMVKAVLLIGAGIVAVCVLVFLLAGTCLFWVVGKAVADHG